MKIDSKRELEKFCRTAIITKSELSDLILICRSGVIPLGHIPVFHREHPEHLIPKPGETGALFRNGVGPMGPDAAKVARKISQMFKERRLFCAHMFWLKPCPAYWDLIYFDQRDIDQDESHWEHGSHVHLANWVTHPQLSANEVLAQLKSDQRPKLSGSLHIRFDNESPEVEIDDL